ncbi:methyl-accepting chemotaxis protein [Rhizobium tumorigenes]|uniref:methyl-accepting chemotaxis protein n=1 Tax=Rhizobium tumorigenes TaxID=2041385 RepID=UPI00241FEA4A|nr:methyl-accepting chemotaxis protein [Rhizobium tumorigenes]WFR99550.1 methyl-accepting chemotaxis protein [Rhizobium tumorigenes]
MKINLSRTLLLFGLVVGAGLLVSIGLQTYAIEKLKVNGPIYKSIVEGKDLVADILPPPLYLIETYMLANEIGSNPDLYAVNAGKIRSLRKDYDERRAYWRASGLPDGIKNELENDVLAKGDLFWKVMDERFLSTDSSVDRHVALMELKDAFHTHEAAVLELVKMSDALSAAQEAETARMSFSLMSLALGAGGLSVVVFLAGLVTIRQRAIRPITKMTTAMSKMAGGNLDEAAPYADRTDEIGAMSAALNVFRTAGLENRSLHDQAEASRAQTETERRGREAERLEEARQVKMVIDALGAGLGRLAQCNMQTTIDANFSEQFEPLRADFNNSLANFQTTLEEVLQKTRLVHGNGTEMQEAAHSLSKRTEEQASALEETSAALEEVTATVRSSSERSLETRNLVADAKQCAQASITTVQESVAAMNRIQAASGEITQIIGVIDEIAFQTNLLALNAGVEAARAGDQGKGFAVVAHEVRELAQRSAKAAKEIKTLIVNSSNEVSTGVRLVGETGIALRKIEGFVADIDAKVEAIATSSVEQATGLQEISSAVNALDQMTQRNAAMAEETTALSNELFSGSSVLTELVGRFKLNRTTTLHHEGTDADDFALAGKRHLRRA